MKSCPHLKAEERRKETLSQPPPFKRRPATGHHSRDSPRIPKGSRAAAPRPKRRPGEGRSLAEKRAGGEGHRRDRRTGTASRWRGGSLRPLRRGARLLRRFCRRPGGERPRGPGGGPHRAGRFPQASACRSTGTPAAPGLSRNGPGLPCLAGRTHAQAAKRAEEETLPYAAPELGVLGRGSDNPSTARLQLRRPRPLFLLQQRRLVKGKDVRGGGRGRRRVSRYFGGTLAQPGSPGPAPRS